MQDIKFEIKEELGILSESAKGWTKEVNLMGKGITLTAEEAEALYKILAKIVED